MVRPCILKHQPISAMGPVIDQWSNGDFDICIAYSNQIVLLFIHCHTLQIYGDKDADGFFLGEVGNLRGLVPGNMVSEVQVDDPVIANQLLKESSMGPKTRKSSSPRVRHKRPNRSPNRQPRDREPRGPKPNAGLFSHFYCIVSIFLLHCFHFFTALFPFFYSIVSIVLLCCFHC